MFQVPALMYAFTTNYAQLWDPIVRDQFVLVPNHPVPFCPEPNCPGVQLSGTLLSIFLFGSCFVYSTTTIYPEISIRKCIKVKLSAESNLNPLRRSPALLNDTPRHCCTGMRDFSIYTHFDRAPSFSLEPFRNMRPGPICAGPICLGPKCPCARLFGTHLS